MFPKKLCYLLLFISSFSNSEESTKPAKISKQQARFLGVPAEPGFIEAYHFHDKSGEHILTLYRNSGPSPSNPRSGQDEYISLIASYYTRNSGKWGNEWSIRDFIDCPRLDAHANFMKEGLAFTDLNSDGLTEVTVSYKTACAGAIEPSTIKVILRDGKKKFAVRGESLILLPRQESFGGEHIFDKGLAIHENIAYKNHLESVWSKVYIDRRETTSGNIDTP